MATIKHWWWWYHSLGLLQDLDNVHEILKGNVCLQFMFKQDNDQKNTPESPHLDG